MMYNDDHIISSRERITPKLQQRTLEELTRCQSCRREAPAQQEKCGVEKDTWGLHGYPLASVYSPMQHWQDIYELEIGFANGTIFKELYLPFLCGEKKGGCGCVK